MVFYGKCSVRPNGRVQAGVSQLYKVMLFLFGHSLIQCQGWKVYQIDLSLEQDRLVRDNGLDIVTAPSNHQVAIEL